MRKWLLISLTIIVGLVAVFVVVVGRNLESYLNDNKELVLEQLEGSLGRDIQIGQIGLSFGTGVGVRIDGLVIADDPAISEEPFIEARSIAVNIKIIPALLGRYEVGRIEFIEPRVTIIATADGMNIATLGGTTPESPVTGQAAAQPDASDAVGATALAIALFDVSDGRIRYIDRTKSPAVETVVEQLNFSATDISPTAPLIFELSAALGAADDANLFVNGSVGPVDTDAPSEAPLDLTISVDGVTGEQVASLSILAAGLPPELQVKGPLELEATLTGTLESMAVTTAGRATQADIRYGESFHKTVGTDLRFSFSANRTLETIAFEDAQAVLGPIRTTMSGTVTTTETTSYDLRAVATPFAIAQMAGLSPSLEGATLDGKMGFDLHATSGKDGSAQIAGTIGLESAGLRQAEMPPIRGFTTTIKLGTDSVDIPPTTFFIGDAEANITAAITNLASPTGNLSITAPMLTPTSLGLSGIGQEGDRLGGVDLQAKLTTEKDQSRIRGTLKSSGGRVSGVDYTNLSAEFMHADGRVKLDPASLKAFGGSIETSGTLAVAEGVASNFDLRVRTRGVDVKQLAAWASPTGGQLLGGTIDASVDLRGAAGEWEKMRTTLSGDGKLKIRDGRIEDVNIAEDVMTAVTGIPGLTTLLSPTLRNDYPGLFSSGSTEFETLESSLDMVNGRVTTRDLRLAAADYAIAADGSVGLDRQVDLNARLMASKKLSRDLIDSVGAVKFLSNNSGRVEIPFTLRGDIASAKARPDGAVIARAIQRALLGGITDQLLRLGR